MTDVNDAAGVAVTKRGRASAFRSWKLIVLVLAALAGVAGGTGYWYWSRQSAPGAAAHVAEPPFYLELKPFVVSIANGDGTPHFVQLGVSLALSGKDAGNAVTALLPEIQDALRQTALGFRVEDIVTPAGVDRLRQAMIMTANQLLRRRLGAAEVKRLDGGKMGGGKPDGGVVQNLYFSTLIVE